MGGGAGAEGRRSGRRLLSRVALPGPAEGQGPADSALGFGRLPASAGSAATWG